MQINKSMKIFVAKYYLRKTRDKVMENKVEIKQKRELPSGPVKKKKPIKMTICKIYRLLIRYNHLPMNE